MKARKLAQTQPRKLARTQARKQPQTPGASLADAASAQAAHAPLVVVVGSGGRMGRALMARGAATGQRMTGVDRPLTPERLEAACARADMALLCVPAAVFDQVAAACAAHLPGYAVMADITSVKERPLRQMERRWPGPVVGTHPLFGPGAWTTPGGTPAARELRVAVTPGARAAEAHLSLVEGFFAALGCSCFRCTAQEHDQAVARIQNMNFITNLAYFALLAGHEELLPFLTPSFQRRKDAAARMLTEDAELFSGLFEANAHSHEAVRQYRKMLNVAAAGDVELLCRRARWWWPDSGPEHGPKKGETPVNGGVGNHE